MDLEVVTQSIVDYKKSQSINPMPNKDWLVAHGDDQQAETHVFWVCAKSE